MKESSSLVLKVGGGLVVNTEVNGITGHELEWFRPLRNENNIIK